MTLRLLSGAFISGLALITAVTFFVAPGSTMPEPWVIAVLLGLVAASTVVSLVLVGTVRAAHSEDSLASMLTKVQPVHIMRLAITEFPALIAVVLMFLNEEPSWVTAAIATVPTILLMLAFVYPHAGVLSRYERALDADGARTRFTDRMLGRVS